MNQKVREYSEFLSDDMMGVGGMVILDLSPGEISNDPNYTAKTDFSGLVSCLNPETEPDKS